MVRRLSYTLGLLALGGILALTSVPEVAAQGRGPTEGRRAADDGWWDVEPRRESRADSRREYRRESRREYRRESRRDHRSDRRARAYTKNAPPFCRSGAGHPVHGYRWCVDKGFAPPRYHRYDRDDRYYDRYHDRRYWHHRRYARVIVVRREPVRVVRPRVVFEARVIIDLLGARLYRDIHGYGVERGYRGEPVARWVPYGDRGWVLQVRQDGYPLAELVDFDGDRRIDDVWFYDDDRGRRW